MVSCFWMECDIIMYLQVIVLDTRYHRDPLRSDGSILGDTQWGWLEEELRGPHSEITIIASSVQVSCKLVFCNPKPVKWYLDLCRSYQIFRLPLDHSFIWNRGAVFQRKGNVFFNSYKIPREMEWYSSVEMFISERSRDTIVLLVTLYMMSPPVVLCSLLRKFSLVPCVSSLGFSFGIHQTRWELPMITADINHALTVYTHHLWLFFFLVNCGCLGFYISFCWLSLVLMNLNKCSVLIDLVFSVL